MNYLFSKSLFYNSIKYLSAILIIVSATVSNLFAQSQSDYDALKVMLGIEKYEGFVSQKPELAAEYAYINRHGYHVSNAGEKDFSNYPDVYDLEPVYPAEQTTSLSLLENNEWNMYGYGVKPDKNSYNYFRIGTSGKVLTILPIDLAKKNMNTENQDQ